jgi:hypothetical protein
MTSSSSSNHITPLDKRRVTALLLVLIALVYTSQVIHIFRGGADGSSDFDVFYLVGQAFWKGEVSDAYRSLLRAASGDLHIGLRWTYPPPFAIILAPFGLISEWMAYAIFMGAITVAYLYVLRAIDRESFSVSLMVATPAIVVSLASGQNGMLFAAILGLLGLGVTHNYHRVGIHLGLLALKPQMLPAAAVSLLVLNRWRDLRAAAFCCVFLVATSIVAFGPSIWGDFSRTMAETKLILLEGRLPLFRMVSVYASMRSLGFSASVSLLAQALSVVIALGAVVFTARRATPRQHIGVAIFATTLISPYQYDYDLPCVGIALAFLWPTIMRGATATERTICLACISIATVWGLLQDLRLSLLFGDAAINHRMEPWSISGPLLLLCFVIVLRVLFLTTGHTEARAVRRVLE